MTTDRYGGWPASATAWLPNEWERSAAVGADEPRDRDGSAGASSPRIIRLVEPSWLGEVIEDMLARLGPVHRELVGQLAASSPSYQALARASGFVAGSLERFRWLHEALATLANGGDPDTAPLEALAAERRDQGVELEELRGAHRLATDALWRSYLEAVQRVGFDEAQALELGARLHHRLTEELATALTSGYLSATPDRSPGARLITGVVSIAGPTPDLERLCREVAFDPDGPFLAAALEPCHGLALPADLRAVHADLGATTVLLTQHHRSDLDAAEAELHELLRCLAVDAAVGTGSTHRGLAGAASSVDEARRSLAAAVRLGEPGLRYRARWAATMALEAEDEVRGVLAPLIDLLEQEPELMETARAYLAADGSLTRAAEALFLHANTVRYRLVRIGELSGIDVRTMLGGWSLYIALTVALSARPGQDSAQADEGGPARP